MILVSKCVLYIISLSIVLSSVPVAGDTISVQDNLNTYFHTIDSIFEKIAQSPTLKSTKLKPAELLFLKELRKNPVFHSFIRTNSKGIVISEAIRGQKLLREKRDVAGQSWFISVKSKKEPFYSLIKDEERGRYYLLYAWPLLKGEDQFVGSVLAKIDIWDGFYDYSNSVYYPFLIKLNGIVLFDHKWNRSLQGEEKQLTIKGVRKVSVCYIPEEKPSVVAEPVTLSDTTSKVKQAIDTAAAPNASGTKNKAKISYGKIIGFSAAAFVLLFILIMIIRAKMKERALLKSLEDD